MNNQLNQLMAIDFTAITPDDLEAAGVSVNDLLEIISELALLGVAVAK